MTWPARLIAALLALAAPAADAATYDPDLRWRTIETPHFRIHFHQGEEQLADELSQKAETIYATMSAELRWTATMKTEVVLTDRTDRANGFASAVPYNAITIYVTAPWEDSTLSLYEDWTEAIFTHELTHVLHLESHHGIVTAARAIVGRIANTHSISPPWMIEGLATFQETRHTAGGRGRAPYVDMIKRTAVVEDAWPPLGNLDGIQARLPAGNLRYLFGQDFMQYVADHVGEDVWTRWIHTYGSHIPYLLPTKRTFGRSLQGLYFDWRRSRTTTYRQQLDGLEAEGVIEGQVVSKVDASCSAPSFSPDDARMVWSCSDIRTGSALWVAEADGSGAKILKQDFGAKTFTWRADGKAFVYAGTHLVNRFNTWSDIYLYDLASDRVRSLTSGARARDPDFSPDGSRLLLVTNKAQDNQLEVLTVDQRRQALTHHTDHTQYATPRHRPDGKVIAVSIWEGGLRDLWLVAPDGTRLRRLTEDAANDRDPAWSPDGRWLYFSSDRSGIPNIYAIDTTADRLWQVTNVRTGAAKPAINAPGTLLAYDQYAQDGWQIALLPIDPTAFLDRGLLPHTSSAALPVPPAAEVVAWAAPLDGWQGSPIDHRLASPDPEPALAEHPQDGGGTDNFGQAIVEDAYGEDRDYPFHLTPKPYNPARGLLPRYWAPGVALTPRLPETPANPVSGWLAGLPRPFNLPGFQLSASTSARDPLSHFAWSAYLTWRSDAAFVGGGGAVTINKWMPVFTLSASTAAIPRTYQVVDPVASEAGSSDTPVLQDGLRVYFERRISTALTMSYPFTLRSTFFASYDFSDRRAMSDLDPLAYAPSVALRGRLGRLSAGYRYAWSQQTATSISQEDARTFSVVGAVTAPWLGSMSVGNGVNEPITQVQLSAELREYLVIPKAPNHVFALRAAAGVSFNLQGEQFVGNYQLGGNLGDGAFYVRPAEYRMIRGYPFGADRGDTYWLAAGEYRFPIWRMDRGFGTVPAFFRVLHGAVFVDAGNAFNEVQSVPDIFDDSLVGVGAELRLDTYLGWNGGLDFRLGYATGLTQPQVAYGPAHPRSVYLQLGGAF